MVGLPRGTATTSDTIAVGPLLIGISFDLNSVSLFCAHYAARILNPPLNF